MLALGRVLVSEPINLLVHLVGGRDGQQVALVLGLVIDAHVVITALTFGLAVYAKVRRLVFECFVARLKQTLLRTSGLIGLLKNVEAHSTGVSGRVLRETAEDRLTDVALSRGCLNELEFCRRHL